MKKVQIELSELEYSLLLNDSQIHEEFTEILESFVSDGEYCHVSVTEKELANLIRSVDLAAQEIVEKKPKGQFKKISKYLNTL